MTNEELLSVEIVALRNHIIDAGWTRPMEDAPVFRSPSGKYVMIPERLDSNEAFVALRLALSVLVEEEGLPVLDAVLVRLSSADDLLYFGGRFADDLPGQLPLYKASSYYRHTEAYVRSSVAAELSYSASGRPLRGNWAGYFQRVRVGQVIDGSYLVTVHLPLSSFTQEPIARRTMQRVIRCLEALGEADIRQSETPLLEMGESGWNAPMCEAVGEFIDDLKPTAIEALTSPNPTWRGNMQIPPQKVEIAVHPPIAVQALGIAASSFRGIKESYDVTVEGFPFGLDDRETLHESSLNLVRIRWNRPDQSSVNVHLELEPSQYRTVLEAHRRHWQISVSGIMTRRGMLYYLERVHNLRVLN